MPILDLDVCAECVRKNLRTGCEKAPGWTLEMHGTTLWIRGPYEENYVVHTKPRPQFTQKHMFAPNITVDAEL